MPHPLVQRVQETFQQSVELTRDEGLNVQIESVLEKLPPQDARYIREAFGFDGRIPSQNLLDLVEDKRMAPLLREIRRAA